MVPWWHIALIVIFGALAVMLIIGGFVIGMFYSFRGFPSKAYQIFAITLPLGTISGSIAMAIVFRDLWIVPFAAALALFIALPTWLMSRFTKL